MIWLKDMVAALGLLGFIACAFTLAGMAGAVLS